MTMAIPRYFEPDPHIPDADLLGYGDIIYDNGKREYVSNDPELVAQLEIKPVDVPDLQGQVGVPDLMQQQAQPLQGADGQLYTTDLKDPDNPIKPFDPLAGNSLAMPAQTELGGEQPGPMGIQSVGMPVRPDGSSMQTPEQFEALMSQPPPPIQGADGQLYTTDLKDPDNPIKPVDESDGLQLTGRQGALPPEMAARQRGELAVAQTQQMNAEMQARADELRITREANAKRTGEVEAERAEAQRQLDEQKAKADRLEKESMALAKMDIERDGYSAYGNNPLSAAMAVIGAALLGSVGSDAGLRMIQNKIDTHVRTQLEKRNSVLNQLADQLGSTRQAVAGYKAKVYELAKQRVELNMQKTKGDVFEAQNPAILEGLEKNALLERQKFDQESIGKRIEERPKPVAVPQAAREGYGKAAAGQTQAEKDVMRALNVIGGKWDPTTGKITNRAEIEKEGIAGVNDQQNFLRDLGKVPVIGALPQAYGNYVLDQKGRDVQSALQAMVEAEATRLNPGKAPTDADREAARQSLGLTTAKGVVDALERSLNSFEAGRASNVATYGEQAAGAVEGSMQRQGQSRQQQTAPGQWQSLSTDPAAARQQVEQERARQQPRNTAQEALDQQGIGGRPTSTAPAASGQERMAQVSEEIQARAGAELPPEGLAILEAQAAHETGNGESMPNFNAFGHKSSGRSRAAGRGSANLATTEGEGSGARRVRQNFATYQNAGESVADHIDLLKRKFPTAWEALQAGDVDAYVAALKEGNYFTGNESAYANSLRQRL